MRKQLTFIAAFALLNLLIACGGSDEKTTQQADAATTETAAESDDDESDKGESLIADDLPAPVGFTFDRKELDGLGTIELPAGKDWSVENNPYGKTYYNETLDMTVKIQTQKEGHLDQMKEYVDSYYQNNLRDAPGYHQTSLRFGQLSGYTGGIMAGEYNNGEPYVTKDFLFFTPTQCTVLQTRINEKSKDKLEPMADYMIASLKK